MAPNQPRTTTAPADAPDSTASMPRRYRILAWIGGVCALGAKPLVESNHKVLQILGGFLLVPAIVFTGASGGDIGFDALGMTPMRKEKPYENP